MTIHDSHPFADPTPDPARRLRGRLGGRVSAWTAGAAGARAGLTVSSSMLANGDPARLLALLDPESDLVAAAQSSGRACVGLLEWRHVDLAEILAGRAPSPGGPFRWGTWRQTSWGPLPDGVGVWAGVRLVDVRPVGWSLLVDTEIEHVEVGEEREPLMHRRGRYERV